jgi:leucyl/phenylalanyl-tRNA--protein transferase
MIPMLGPADPFPPVDEARDDAGGLLAAGGGLSTGRLVDAYTRGIFPWFSDGDPILWWSPDPRMVLAPRELHVSRSLRRRLRRRGFTVTADAAFHDVIDACAAPRADDAGTWLGPAMQRAYRALHAEGLAHAVEVWMDGRLAGGVYGVAIGRMFFGESMFSRRVDGSKIALAYLAAQLDRWGFPWIDCQLATAHLASLGARTIPRATFVRNVAELVRRPGVPAPWKLDDDLPDAVARWGAGASPCQTS